MYLARTLNTPIAYKLACLATTPIDDLTQLLLVRIEVGVRIGKDESDIIIELIDGKHRIGFLRCRTGPYANSKSILCG